jgi:hypothetical protein
MNIFDHISNITWKKTRWSELSESDAKSFSPFMVNRILSMDINLISILNDLQKYTVGLIPAEASYKLYSDFLPKQKIFNKYIKAKAGANAPAELVERVAEYYLISKSEAEDLCELMSDTAKQELLSSFGIDSKQIKKILSNKDNK